MAAAAGKKSTTSLSLFMEAYGLEVEEELSTLASQYWAEGVSTGKWHHEQREAWLRQIREVQTWKQLRGPAGAVMCETRDLGIKWPHWHTLVFEGDRRIDMRYVCPKDVKKMLVQQGRTICWKKWAAKHEYEEFKEDIWLEPALALLREKTKEDWTEKHQHVARKLVLEGGWLQKKLFDIGWSDESEMSSLSQGERYRKAQTLPLPRMARDQTGDSRGLSESARKKPKLQNKGGSGKEALSHILSVNAIGTGAISV